MELISRERQNRGRPVESCCTNDGESRSFAICFTKVCSNRGFHVSAMKRSRSPAQVSHSLTGAPGAFPVTVGAPRSCHSRPFLGWKLAAGGLRSCHKLHAASLDHQNPPVYFITRYSPCTYPHLEPVTRHIASLACQYGEISPEQ